MRRAAWGLTKPAAGVIEPRPATVPDMAPSMVGLPLCTHSKKAHVRVPMAAAALVATKAFTATPSLARALPALKPNQPNQSTPMPITVRVRLRGGISSLGQPLTVIGMGVLWFGWFGF